MRASNRDAGDQGITAVVGTVLVLAITVTGITVALFLGTPVIQRLQNEAALDTVVGHFEAARQVSGTLTVDDTSRSTPLPVPSGMLSVGLGSHFLVVMQRTGCDLRVTGWTDWGQSAADRVTLTTAGCPATNHAVAPAPPPAPWDPTCPGSQPQTCIRAFDLTSGFKQVSTGYGAGVLTFNAPLVANRDYLIQINTTATPIAEAWLLHTDRLSWSRDSVTGGVAAYLEAGGLFAKENAVLYRVAGPRLDEGLGASLSLALPTFSSSSAGSTLGEGTHTLYQNLTTRELRTAVTDATRVRFEVHGELAEAWCNTLLQRTSRVPLTQGAYAALPSISGCGANSEGVRGVQFTRNGGLPFPFQFGQPILHAYLQL